MYEVDVEDVRKVNNDFASFPDLWAHLILQNPSVKRVEIIDLPDTHGHVLDRFVLIFVDDLMYVRFRGECIYQRDPYDNTSSHTITRDLLELPRDREQARAAIHALSDLTKVQQQIQNSKEGIAEEIESLILCIAPDRFLPDEMDDPYDYEDEKREKKLAKHIDWLRDLGLMQYNVYPDLSERAEYSKRSRSFGLSY